MLIIHIDKTTHRFTAIRTLLLIILKLSLKYSFNRKTDIKCRVKTTLVFIFGRLIINVNREKREEAIWC